MDREKGKHISKKSLLKEKLPHKSFWSSFLAFEEGIQL